MWKGIIENKIWNQNRKSSVQVDEFYDDNEGLIIAEIELSSKKNIY
jgi:CYTH domain-containing protein